MKAGSDTESTPEGLGRPFLAPRSAVRTPGGAVMETSADAGTGPGAASGPVTCAPPVHRLQVPEPGSPGGGGTLDGWSEGPGGKLLGAERPVTLEERAALDKLRLLGDRIPGEAPRCWFLICCSRPCSA